MTQTYFDYPPEDRYTWFSGDGNTKKVIDYVLAEPFIQQYVNDCAVNANYDLESDHRLIIAKMLTPTSKKS